MNVVDHSSIVLSGSALTIAELVRVARDPRVNIKCDKQAMERVKQGRAQIEQVVETYRKDPSTKEYGVTTGFGEFKDIAIPPQDLEQLQRNILLSHAVGVGENCNADDLSNYFPAEVVRATLVLRLNTFLKGHSGVRPELVEWLVKMVNRGIVPLVPVRGSVGSSGDLCPLAHLFVVLLGEGQFYIVEQPEDFVRLPREFKPASELAQVMGIATLPVLSYKEGLALTNGAAFSAAMLALAVYDAEQTVNVADVSAALTLEAMCGCARAFDSKIHEARGHNGQIHSAINVRSLIQGSKQVDRTNTVQDAYSLRCAPQVHGTSRDTIGYARMVVEREINAATDNPLFFPGNDADGKPLIPWDIQFRDNWPESFKRDKSRSYSGGNFHGQPVALAADFLAIALAELADISERRTQMLLDSNHNRFLPANLIPKRGVNSGYMIAQYSAASLVSENKVLAHPASVDSIPTSANSEDHNSMATIAARKLRTVLGNTQAVLAIELMVAAQAIEWRVAMAIGPLKSAGEKQPSLEDAEEEAHQFKEKTGPEHRETIVRELGRGTGVAYKLVREAAMPMHSDRVLDTDIRNVRRIVENGSLAEAVSKALPNGLKSVSLLRPV